MKFIERKMKQVMFILLLSVCFWSCKKEAKSETGGAVPKNQHRFDSLNLVLQDYEKSKVLPGFAVSIFNKDSILYSKAFGFSNKEDKIAYNTTTVQGIASVSKTFIAVSLMKAIEKDLLDLDDNISKYLPYKVSNPNYPDTPITIRQLATHTSSFDDPIGGIGNIFSEKLNTENWREVWHPIIAGYNKNKDMPMDQFLEKVFTDKTNFMKERPGSYYEYSNYGSALLAHIIEIVTKTDYKTFTEKEIFKPLKMNQTSWDYEETDMNHITYYNDNYAPLPKYHIITYPDGGMYTSIEDLTKFLQEMIKGYYGESDFLSKSSYEEMFSSQSKLLDTNTGLLWDLDQSCCIGHGGNDFGIATMMYFGKRDGIGRIVFTNLDVQQEEQDDTFYGIFGETFNY